MNLSGAFSKRGAYLLFLTTVLLVLTVAPQVVRFNSLVRYSDMQVDTGCEGQNFYNIWRVMNHHPLYADPWKPPFSVTLYNFGFYYFFGAIANLLGVHDAGIMLFSRLLSLIFAIIGAFVMAKLIMFLSGKHDGPAAWAAVMLALSAWLGLNSTVWWSMSGRPDMPSCAFALLGCLLYVQRLKSSNWVALLPAGLSFAAAWSFKQSSVWSAGACVLFAIFVRRKWQDVLALMLPGVVILVLVKILAPGVYWQNIVAAPVVDAFSFNKVLHNGLEVVLPDIAFFVVPLLVLLNGRIRRALIPPEEPQSLAMRLMFFVCIVDIGLGIVAIGREGASRNQFYEALFACATLASALIISAFFRADLQEDSLRAIRAVAVTSLLVMIPLPVATLLRPEMNSGFLHWHLTWMNSSAYAQRKRLVAELQSYPRPLFTRDEVLSLPWISSSDTYPSPTTDEVWYGIASSHGELTGSLATEVAAHDFGTLVLIPQDPLVTTAVAAGYTIKARYNTVNEFGGSEKMVILSR